MTVRKKSKKSNQVTEFISKGGPGDKYLGE